jgi:CheY-like chemotaxis protein
MENSQELKLLLAEDNPISQRIMMFTFRKMGVQCDFALNGKEAYEMYQKNLYHLILMDMEMPVMDGMEASKLIRNFELENNLSKRAYIVALTGNEISEKKQECMQAGMDDFMEKPIQEHLLAELIAKSF